MVKKFLDMRKMTETVAEITTKFQECDLLVPQYVVEDEMRNTRYHDTLRSNIREYVSFSTCPKLEHMISRAWEWEIDLEHIRKRREK